MPDNKFNLEKYINEQDEKYSKPYNTSWNTWDENDDTELKSNIS